MNIRNLKETDWERVAQIYLLGIATGDATFEKQAPSWATWDKAHTAACRLVAEIEGAVVGWAALSPVSSRCVYEGVAEVSLYIHTSFLNRGLGKSLLKELIETSETEGIWTLESSIFPENHSSIHLHQKLGFRKVGYREKIGKMNGQWRDTVIFERRSAKV